MLNNVKTILEDKKAEDVQIMDLRGAGYFTDFVVVATMTSTKQTMAMVDELSIRAKDYGTKLYASEISEDWAVLDFGDFVVHLLSPEYRQRYKLEEFLQNFAQNKSTTNEI